MELGKVMREGRKRLGVTLDVASRNIGVSLTYLCDIEKGRVPKLKMDTIYAAANFYGIDVDELCIASGRIPKDIFYKIANNPHKMFAAVRSMEV